MSLDRKLKYLLPLYGDVLLGQDLSSRFGKIFMSDTESDTEDAEVLCKGLGYASFQVGFTLSKYAGYISLIDYISDFFKQ